MKRIERIYSAVSVSVMALIVLSLVFFRLASVGETQQQATATATATGTAATATETATSTSTPESPVGHHQYHIYQQTHDSITVNFTYSLGYDRLDCIFVEFVNAAGDWAPQQKFDRTALIRASDTEFRITFSHLVANRAYTYRIVVQERSADGTPIPGIIQYSSPPQVAWTRPQPTQIYASHSEREAYRLTATAQGTEVGPLVTSTAYPETGAQQDWRPGTPTPNLPVRQPNDSSSGSNIRPQSTDPPRSSDGPLPVGAVCGSSSHGHYLGIFLNGVLLPENESLQDNPGAERRYGPMHSHDDHILPGGSCGIRDSDIHGNYPGDGPVSH